MKKLEKTMMTIIIISIAWMAIQTIYGVGRAKGYEKAYTQAREEVEEQIRLDYEARIDQEQDKCADLIQQAIDETRDEILSQF